MFAVQSQIATNGFALRKFLVVFVGVSLVAALVGVPAGTAKAAQPIRWYGYLTVDETGHFVSTDAPPPALTSGRSTRCICSTQIPRPRVGRLRHLCDQGDR